MCSSTGLVALLATTPVLVVESFNAGHKQFQCLVYIVCVFLDMVVDNNILLSFLFNYKQITSMYLFLPLLFLPFLWLSVTTTCQPFLFRGF